MPDGMNISPALSSVLSQMGPALQDDVTASKKLQDASGEAVKAIDTSAAEKKAVSKEFSDALKPPQIQEFKSPAPTPFADKFGSAAMMIASLGSLFVRGHATAALNAGAAALNAFNQNDIRNQDTAFEQWKVNTDNAIKMHQFELDAYRAAMEGASTDEASAIAKVNTIAAAMKNSPLQAILSAGGKIAEIGNYLTGMETAQAGLEKSRAEGSLYKDVLDASREFKQAVSLPDTDPTKAERMQQARAKFDIANEAVRGRPQPLTLSTEQAAAVEEQVSKGVPRDQAIENVRKATSAGGTQATQINSMTSATNEVAGALQNLTDLPIAATAGWFKGAQYERPESLSDAIRRSLANKLTSEDSQAVQVSFQGVARSLATLEGAGRATGLVGLTQSAQGLMPQVGDTGLTVMRKYAEVRQIAERAIETIKERSGADPKQVKLLDKALSQITTAVPWTVRDVNDLQRVPSAENVQAFAKRMQDSLKEQPKTHQVGDIITQDGKQYKATAVDENGNVTAADEVK